MIEKIEPRTLEENMKAMYKENIIDYAFRYGTDCGYVMRNLMYKFKWNVKELEKIAGILDRHPWETDPNLAFWREEPDHINYAR